jgi:hypothetical protein
MLQRWQALLAVALALASGPVWAGEEAAEAAARWAVGQQLLKLPLHLEPEADAGGFVSRGPGYALRVEASSTQFLLRGSSPAAVQVELRGSNRKAEGRATDPLPGRSHYFLGDDPSRWRRDVPHYGRVEYRGVYPGIDVAYYGRGGLIEYDFIVGAGADPGRIRLRFRGAEGLRIDGDGDIVVSVEGGGELVQRAPVAYQEGGKGREAVRARFVKRGKREVGFAVGEYDRSRSLVIDPVLVYSTYLGGSLYDFAYAIAVDGAGDAYVAGRTASSDLPTATVFQPTLAGGYDAFVTKLDASGSAVVYSTYLGGSYVDEAHAIAVDGAGNAYVAGSTASSDFPTANAFQPSYVMGYEAFVAKLDASGSALVYSTYLGGTSVDEASAIAVDDAGSAYVAGYTWSVDFPTAHAFQPTRAGGYSADAFVTKLSASGRALVYSSYLGGSEIEQADAVAVDSAGNAFVAGHTASTDFPTANALQATNAGVSDAFVTKLDAFGTALVYSTYLGGSGDDRARAIAVDSTGNAYPGGAGTIEDG